MSDPTIDPTPGVAVQETAPGSSPASVPTAADQPADTGSTATGQTNEGAQADGTQQAESLSVFQDLVGEQPKPAAEPPAEHKTPEGAADEKPEPETPPEPEAEDGQETEPTTEPEGKPQVRGRIKNLEAQVETFQKAFANVDAALAGIPPEEARTALAQIGAALKGDEQAKAALLTRLGAPTQAPPSTPQLPADLAAELADRLADYGETELADRVRGLAPKPDASKGDQAKPATPADQKPTEGAPQGKPAEQAAPQADPAMAQAVQGIQQQAQALTQEMGKEAPAILTAAADIYERLVKDHIDTYGEEPPASGLAKVFTKAVTQAKAQAAAQRKTPPPATRPSVGSRQPKANPLSVFEDLTAGA